MEGIRFERSVAELCRKCGISDSTYYKWNKDFIEAGTQRLEGDMLREATGDEFRHKTRFANEMWQTNFPYFKVKGWGMVQSFHCDRRLQSLYQPLGAVFKHDR